MAEYNVVVLVQYTYTVEADSESEAEEKALAGDFLEENMDNIDQVTSVDKVE